jgi:hypothetical protein
VPLAAWAAAAVLEEGEAGGPGLCQHAAMGCHSGSHSAAAGRRRGMRRFVREVKACRTYVVQPAVRT